MGTGDEDRGRAGEDAEHRMARERERASREERESADGPGYTARPTDEEPEGR